MALKACHSYTKRGKMVVEVITSLLTKWYLSKYSVTKDASI